MNPKRMYHYSNLLMVLCMLTFLASMMGEYEIIRMVLMPLLLGCLMCQSYWRKRYWETLSDEELMKA